MQTLKDHFCVFCSRTTLHGWQFLGHHFINLSAPCIYWTAIVLLSSVTGLYGLYYTIDSYFEATPITSLENVTIPLSEIYFPSIVVCNINQVRQSYFAELGITDNEEFIDQIYNTFIDGILENQSSYNNTPEEQIILQNLTKKFKPNESSTLSWDMSQKCEDMLLGAQWKGSKWHESNLEWGMETDFGMCCYYTPQLNSTQTNS